MSTRKSMRIASLESHEEPMNDEETTELRRSGRVRTPNKRYELIQEMLKPSRRTKSKEKRDDSIQDDESASISEDSEAGDENQVKCSAAFFNAATDVAGNEIFGFRTPKKRDGMKRLAENTPKTPVTLIKTMTLNTPSTPKTPKTPSTALKTLSLNSPRSTKTSHAIRAQQLATPNEIRTRNKRVLQKGARKITEESETESSADEHSDYEVGESSESSDDVTADSSSDEEMVTNKSMNKRNVMPNKTKTVQLPTRSSARGRPKKKTCDDEFIPHSDNYFIAASNKKAKTSDHTLDRLKSSRLQHEELFSLLNSINASEEHQHRIADLLNDLRQNFDRWMLEMHEGYNIILYGTGSKQQLIHEFCEQFLSDKPLIVVNGFFPSLTVKDILQAIKVQLLELTANSRNDHETVDLIASALDSMPNGHIFLVINNIDGVMLRKTKDQHIISRLAKIKNIHLIASIDHINAPLMWDQTCMDNFNFIWNDCTTMMPYKNETAFENSVFFQSSGELDLAAMSNVFRSLTTNARGIYMILVKNQLENHKDSNYQGMAFKELYQKCRESFLVSSDSTLRTQLIEFVDHKMAKLKRSLDATELVSIPIGHQILSLFTQQQNE